MENKTKKVKISYIILGIFVISIIFLVVKYKYEHTFSTNRWIRYPSERVNMVDDMLGKHDLIGRSKEQVIELLGNKTENAYFKESNNLVYYMGDERGLISIDSEWLVITFADNVVIDVKIMRD